MISRRWQNNSHAIVRVALLLVSLLALAVGTSAEVPRHAPTDHAAHQGMDHSEMAPKNMEHAGHDMAGHDHDKPAEPATMDHTKHPQGEAPPDHSGHDMAASGHVHPSAEAAPPDAVGLDEKLGDTIPLDLTFFDENGQPVKLADLVTMPTVIAPIYYRCPNVCHFLQGDLARVLPQLKLKAGEEYQVLSISFDENEKPELAKRSRDTYYAAMKNNYPPKAWRFLTGDLDAIMALTGSAGFRFHRVGTDFLHPVVFFVVSPEGKIVRYLHGTHVLPKDLTLALYEAQQGHVGTTIRKVVQYCFSFDPEQKTYVFNLLRVSATAILGTMGIFLAFLVFGGKKSKRGSKS